MVHDCGHLINPMIVEGQIHGGVAQGVGGALYERMAYDESGQLLNASFMDFLMPYVTEVPARIDIDHLETPSPLNPLGIKGAGEAGVIPSAAVFAAAIEDAEAPHQPGEDHGDADLAVGPVPPARAPPTRGDPMKFTGENTLHAPVDQVWDALLDPAVLVRTIPGCERLEATGENAYAMTVTAGVAAIKGTYSGSCTLSDLVPHESLVMRLDGAGAPGTVGATVQVRFAAPDEGTTTVAYDADAVVGGMVGGVGQRMLTSVSRRMAGEFFGNVDGVLTGRQRHAPAVQRAAGRPEAAPRRLHRRLPVRPVRLLADRLPHGHRGRRRAGAARGAAGPSAMMAA